MAILNPSDLTFNGKEIQMISEGIKEAVFAKPAITDFHTPYEDIKAKQQIAFLGRLNGLVGKKQPSNTCAPTANPAGITNTQKFWEPVYITDRFTECFTNLLEIFFVWGLKNGIQKADLTSTDFAVFLEERIGDEMYEAILRMVWFGDKQAANFNGSPAGTITNGIDVDFFNPIDGLWKQIYAIVAANPAQGIGFLNFAGNNVNAGATYALQEFTSTGANNDVVNLTATKTLRNMIKKADTRLSGRDDLIFVVTKSVFDQLGDERTYGAGNGVSEAFNKFENGFATTRLDGVTLISFDFWDRMIRTYQNDGTKYFRPHRAILTTASQLAVGTEEVSGLATLDPFYDKKDKQYYVDFGFNLDAKFLEDYMLMAAY